MEDECKPAATLNRGNITVQPRSNNHPDDKWIMGGCSRNSCDQSVKSCSMGGRQVGSRPLTGPLECDSKNKNKSVSLLLLTCQI